MKIISVFLKFWKSGIAMLMAVVMILLSSGCAALFTVPLLLEADEHQKEIKRRAKQEADAEAQKANLPRKHVEMWDAIQNEEEYMADYVTSVDLIKHPGATVIKSFSPEENISIHIIFDKSKDFVSKRKYEDSAILYYNLVSGPGNEIKNVGFIYPYHSEWRMKLVNNREYHMCGSEEHIFHMVQWPIAVPLKAGKWEVYIFMPRVGEPIFKGREDTVERDSQGRLATVKRHYKEELAVKLTFWVNDE